MTALEFANTHDNVCLFLVSLGYPAGNTLALLAETQLPFDLEEIEGDVTGGDVFEATNLNDGSDARGWKFRDWNRNLIYKLQLFTNAAEWSRQNEDYESACA